MLGRCRNCGCLQRSHAPPSRPSPSPPLVPPFMPNTAYVSPPLSSSPPILSPEFCSVHTAHRRSFAVKHSDGEPLTRADLQYDLLHHIFSNTQAVFSDPYRTLNGAPAGTKVTFRELYINSLLHSPRCSKASRDKIIESPAFGIEFSKMSLLSNVGRINTTMACEYASMLGTLQAQCAPEDLFNCSCHRVPLKLTRDRALISGHLVVDTADPLLHGYSSSLLL